MEMRDTEQTPKKLTQIRVGGRVSADGQLQPETKTASSSSTSNTSGVSTSNASSVGGVSMGGVAMSSVGGGPTSVASLARAPPGLVPSLPPTSGALAAQL